MDDNADFRLIFDDNSTQVCTVIGVFKALDRDYLAFMPHDGSNHILFGRVNNGLDANEGEVTISELMSDMEYDEVLSVFDSLVSEIKDTTNITGKTVVKAKMNNILNCWKANNIS